MADLDHATSRQPVAAWGVLMQDVRLWAQASHDALTGHPAAALQHFEQMTQPTLTRLAAYDRLDAAARPDTSIRPNGGSPNSSSSPTPSTLRTPEWLSPTGGP